MDGAVARALARNLAGPLADWPAALPLAPEIVDGHPLQPRFMAGGRRMAAHLESPTQTRRVASGIDDTIPDQGRCANGGLRGAARLTDGVAGYAGHDTQTKEAGMGRHQLGDTADDLPLVPPDDDDGWQPGSPGGQEWECPVCGHQGPHAYRPGDDGTLMARCGGCGITGACDTEALPPGKHTAAGQAASQALMLIRRPRHYWRQIDRAVWFLADNAGVAAAGDDLIQRAMHILRAKPDAPALERDHGYRANLGMAGSNVTCRACKRTWCATPEDPYLNASTPADGICTTCVIMPPSEQEPASDDGQRDDGQPANDDVAVSDQPQADHDPGRD